MSLAHNCYVTKCQQSNILLSSTKFQSDVLQSFFRNIYLIREAVNGFVN